jgi:hypothetical protein
MQSNWTSWHPKFWRDMDVATQRRSAGGALALAGGIFGKETLVWGWNKTLDALAATVPTGAGTMTFPWMDAAGLTLLATGLGLFVSSYRKPKQPASATSVGPASVAPPMIDPQIDRDLRVLLHFALDQATAAMLSDLIESAPREIMENTSIDDAHSRERAAAEFLRRIGSRLEDTHRYASFRTIITMPPLRRNRRYGRHRKTSGRPEWTLWTCVDGQFISRQIATLVPPRGTSSLAGEAAYCSLTPVRSTNAFHFFASAPT